MALILKIYELDIGEIYATFGTYMADISDRYDLSTVFSRVRHS